MAKLSNKNTATISLSVALSAILLLIAIIMMVTSADAFVRQYSIGAGSSSYTDVSDKVSWSVVMWGGWSQSQHFNPTPAAQISWICLLVGIVGEFVSLFLGKYKKIGLFCAAGILLFAGILIWFAPMNCLGVNNYNYTAVLSWGTITSGILILVAALATGYAAFKA